MVFHLLKQGVFPGFTGMVLMLFGIGGFPFLLQAQPPSPSRVEPWLAPNHPHLWHVTGVALVGATIIRRAGDTLHDGLLLIRNGRIEYCGPRSGISIPPGYHLISVKGKWIYPAFIDLYTDYGIPRKKPPAKSSSSTASRNRYRGPQMTPSWEEPLSYNEAIRAHQRALESWAPDSADALRRMNMGFAVVASHIPDGIIRGAGILVSLNYRKPSVKGILKPEAGVWMSFQKGSSTQDYPTSLMGAMALLRQVLYDVRWYEQARTRAPHQIPVDVAMENLSRWKQARLPAFLVWSSPQDLWMAAQLIQEFPEWNWISVGTGGEYQVAGYWNHRIPALILPVNLPHPLEEVRDAYLASRIPWLALQHWYTAPATFSLLKEWEYLQIALTAWGIQNPSDWWKNLRKLIRAGASAEDILQALTEIPAHMIGMEQELGTLEPGKRACFLIATSDLFRDTRSKILQVWIDGEPFLEPAPVEIRGKFRFSWTPATPVALLEILGNYNRPTVKVQLEDSTTHSVRWKRKGNQFWMQWILHEKTDSEEIYVVRGWFVSDSLMKGWYRRQSTATREGVEGTFQAIRQEAYRPQYDTTSPRPLTLDSLPRPFSPWGYRKTHIPQSRTWLLKGGWVWLVDEDQDTIVQADILIQNGKIVRVAPDLSPPEDAHILDVRGMHVTPGIIDEHSHIAIRGGVNEAGWAISAEVRIQDVIRYNDVNLFRQLAGGVTTIHLLHGSANPIGGQTAIIKNRWGEYVDGLLEPRAPPFIKFALGENVKQSNWGDLYRIRFPQTRMGVEQIMEDAFRQAQAYQYAWETWESLSRREQAKTLPPRYFLRWEPLKEILEHRRFITCHSYVQSEILMMLRLAERFGFTLNTFTHGLEAYKVADELRKHGAGVSTFSDWWAYKFEVIEATPYNATLCVKMGVTTAVNSDDAEMGRRLNQEAGKSIFYGGLDPISALRLVTLYPARLLHMDDFTGSIQEGKDADLVIWRGYPLSPVAQVQYTFVEGVLRFDRQQYQKLFQQVQEERLTILQQMRKAIENGEKTQKLQEYPRWLLHQMELDRRGGYHCTDVDTFTW